MQEDQSLWRREQLREQVFEAQAGQVYFGGVVRQIEHRVERRGSADMIFSFVGGWFERPSCGGSVPIL